jgi:hypothetical protein
MDLPHSMLLPSWLTQRTASRVAFVLGGSEDDVRRLLSGPGTPPVTLICDRPTAERLSQAAILNGDRPPAVMVSRGFRQDCDALIANAKAQVTLVHASVFARHIEAEHQRLAGRLKLLGGYDVPESLVQRVAMSGVWHHAESISVRLSAPLLIHLPKAPVVPMTAGVGADAFTVFELPGATVDMAPQTPEPTVDVPSEAAGAHAKFLADMELELLCTLHSQLAVDRDHLIFSFWDNVLSAYLRATGQAALVLAARSKLAAIRTRVAPS